ncbi:MAG: hypothetical protein ACFFCW_15540 [Candidatus Hodarchaeota archaeon]
MPEKITTFLSVGEPHNDLHRSYLKALVKYLSKRGINAETLGRTFWSIRNPLKPVQQKMQLVYGAVILAMERFHSEEGVYKEGSDQEKRVGDQYFATVWTQLEAAMAYQLELPLLILKEEKLVAEGMFDPGIHEWMIVRINSEDPGELKRDPIKGFIDSWIEAVRRCYYSRINH